MKLKIIGYSGHANSVLSTIKSLGYEITGYYENVENKAKYKFKIKRVIGRH